MYEITRTGMLITISRIASSFSFGKFRNRNGFFRVISGFGFPVIAPTREARRCIESSEPNSTLKTKSFLGESRD